jgi:hypothetical protein
MATAMAATLTGSPPRAVGQRPIETTLCAIISNPQRFHRVLVQFQAELEVGFENAVLVDVAHCNKGIAPQFSKKIDEERQLRMLA